MKYPDLPRPRCGCGRLVCFETMRRARAWSGYTTMFMGNG